MWLSDNQGMLDDILDDVGDIWTEFRATVEEIDSRLSEAYEGLLDRLGHALLRLGYRLKGEEYEPHDQQ